MISFIIPSYNSANTIKRAIDSILNQNTDLEYEIIIVDDGSTDNTEEVLKCYENDERIKYYKKDNSGVADTRNYGVKMATGEYIIFVDSDDYISENLLNDIERFIRQGIELIKWNVTFVDENLNDYFKPYSVTIENTTGEQGFNQLFGNDNLIDCLWNYAIKKDLMIEFPSGTYHEDFATMPLIIFKAKSFVSINRREYFYVQSENSIMREINTEKTRKKIQDKLTHFDNLINTVNKLNLSQLTKENYGIYATNSLLAVIKDLKGEDKKLYKKELKNRKIWQYIKIRNLKQLIKRMFIIIRLKYDFNITKL
ncbi:MAG: glycosyltransferase family 2 protein [Clostridia bacterium]|nr:glycosyltransferase family 2 protein [Clostridia bacterium]